MGKRKRSVGLQPCRQNHASTEKIRSVDGPSVGIVSSATFLSQKDSIDADHSVQGHASKRTKRRKRTRLLRRLQTPTDAYRISKSSQVKSTTTHKKQKRAHRKFRPVNASTARPSSVAVGAARTVLPRKHVKRWIGAEHADSKQPDAKQYSCTVSEDGLSLVSVTPTTSNFRYDFSRDQSPVLQAEDLFDPMEDAQIIYQEQDSDHADLDESGPEDGQVLQGNSYSIRKQPNIRNVGGPVAPPRQIEHLKPILKVHKPILSTDEPRLDQSPAINARVITVPSYLEAESAEKSSEPINRLVDDRSASREGGEEVKGDTEYSSEIEQEVTGIATVANDPPATIDGPESQLFRDATHSDQLDTGRQVTESADSGEASDVGGNDEHPMDVDVDELETEKTSIDEDTVEDRAAKYGSPESERHSLNPSMWPANVGLKRQNHFLGSELGGNRYGPGDSTELACKKNLLRYDRAESRNTLDEERVDQEDEILFATINSVSNEVFELTRSTNTSTSNHKDLSKDRLGNEVDSKDSHGREKLRSRSSDLRSYTGESISPGSPIVLICNTASLEDYGPLISSNEVDDKLAIAHSGSSSPLSASPLSELSRTPTPPDELIQENGAEMNPTNPTVQIHVDEENDEGQDTQGVGRKRKMTGITSKHFSSTPQRSSKRDRSSQQNKAKSSDALESPSLTPKNDMTPSTRSRTGKKRTAKVSVHFSPSPVKDKDTPPGETSSTPKKRRVPAGTSVALFPPVSAPRFGIIQEKLWDQPFWLLIAVTLLNKTAGKAAVPIFWDIKAKWPSPEALAQADVQTLQEMIHHLGLQRQRSKRLVLIARAWTAAPPMSGTLYRTLHYPRKGDGREYKATEAIDTDAEACIGALEIGRLPGCGPYACDSWRIFCRDVLRGVASDYNGGQAVSEDFVPEWQRVLPLDKELRACLRWMWLREGYIWDPETGERREVTAEEWRRAVQGEIEPVDDQEAKFVAGATGQNVTDEPARATNDGDGTVGAEAGIA